MLKYGFSFSWKSALGIPYAEQRFVRNTSIPADKEGLEGKSGFKFLSILFGKK
jgi:hypothetical protein